MSFLVSKNAFQEVETDEISSFYYQKNYLSTQSPSTNETRNEFYSIDYQQLNGFLN